MSRFREELPEYQSRSWYHQSNSDARDRSDPEAINEVTDSEEAEFIAQFSQFCIEDVIYKAHPISEEEIISEDAATLLAYLEREAHLGNPFLHAEEQDVPIRIRTERERQSAREARRLQIERYNQRTAEEDLLTASGISAAFSRRVQRARLPRQQPRQNLWIPFVRRIPQIIRTTRRRQTTRPIETSDIGKATSQHDQTEGSMSKTHQQNIGTIFYDSQENKASN